MWKCYAMSSEGQNHTGFTSMSTKSVMCIFCFQTSVVYCYSSNVESRAPQVLLVLFSSSHPIPGDSIHTRPPCPPTKAASGVRVLLFLTQTLTSIASPLAQAGEKEGASQPHTRNGTLCRWWGWERHWTEHFKINSGKTTLYAEHMTAIIVCLITRLLARRESKIVAFYMCN